MNEQLTPWNDLRIILAIAQAGTLSGAARGLKLSHATVFRRLESVEKRLGVELFLRARSGYRPTLAGEDLAATAARIEQEVLGAERRLAGRDLKLSGSLRITTTDTLFMGVLAPLISGFRTTHPEINIEVALSNQLFNLSKRDADIALRPSNKPPEMLIGRKVGAVAQAVYGCKSSLAEDVQARSSCSLADQCWVGPDAHLGYTSLDSWMARNDLDRRCAYRLDSVMGMLGAVRAGAGLAVLPCYLGDADPGLLRLGTPIPELATELWLLTHPDLRRVARVRVFMDFLAEELRHSGLGLAGVPQSPGPVERQ